MAAASPTSGRAAQRTSAGSSRCRRADARAVAIDLSSTRSSARAGLARDGDRLAAAGAAPAGPGAETLAAMDRLESALDVPAPPPLSDAARAAGCPPDGIRALESAGRIVRLDDDLAYAADAYRRLEARAVELATAAPLAPAALRDATGTSRKYVMAILEDLDRRGVLRRTPAGHVPGPRAAAATRVVSDAPQPAPSRGIVLAGGRASRFGSDKLDRRVRRRPAPRSRGARQSPSSCSEVIVVLAPDDDRELPAAAVPVRRVFDPERHRGPLVGLLAGLEAAREPVVLVAGGDMPTLSPDVLAAARPGPHRGRSVGRRGGPRPARRRPAPPRRLPKRGRDPGRPPRHRRWRTEPRRAPSRPADPGARRG